MDSVTYSAGFFKAGEMSILKGSFSPNLTGKMPSFSRQIALQINLVLNVVVSITMLQIFPEEPCLEKRIYELELAGMPVDYLQLNQPIQCLFN